MLFDINMQLIIITIYYNEYKGTSLACLSPLSHAVSAAGGDGGGAGKSGSAGGPNCSESY